MYLDRSQHEDLNLGYLHALRRSSPKQYYMLGGVTNDCLTGVNPNLHGKALPITPKERKQFRLRCHPRSLQTESRDCTSMAHEAGALSGSKSR